VTHAAVFFSEKKLRGALELHEKDPNAWWNTFEVNIRGSFNFFRCASRSVAVAYASAFVADAMLHSLISATAAALELSRGYFVATSSGGAQVRIPGTSDMNISKHAVNRLIEFIVLGSVCSFCVGKHRLIACAAQNTLACERLRSRPASSARDCSSKLESESPSIQSRFPRQRRSISRLGARTGFLEGSWTTHRVRFNHACSRAARYYSANWDITEVERDWKDAIIDQEALVNKLSVPRL
jgi:hypothetical protein